MQLFNVNVYAIYINLHPLQKIWTVLYSMKWPPETELEQMTVTAALYGGPMAITRCQTICEGGRFDGQANY